LSGRAAVGYRDRDDGAGLHAGEFGGVKRSGTRNPGTHWVGSSVNGEERSDIAQPSVHRMRQRELRSARRWRHRSARWSCPHSHALDPEAVGRIVLHHTTLPGDCVRRNRPSSAVEGPVPVCAERDNIGGAPHDAGTDTYRVAPPLETTISTVSRPKTHAFTTMSNVNELPTRTLRFRGRSREYVRSMATWRHGFSRCPRLPRLTSVLRRPPHGSE
jgi:hypothetical protein